MMVDLLNALLRAADFQLISREDAKREFMNTVNAMQHGLEVGLFVKELDKRKENKSEKYRV